VHRASFSALQYLAEYVLQIYAQYDQKYNREDLLIVLCDNPRQENVEVRSAVICMAACYSRQRTLPRIHRDDDNLRSDQDERNIEESIEPHQNDGISDIEDGYRHHKPNEGMKCLYEVKHESDKRSGNPDIHRQAEAQSTGIFKT